MLAFHLHLIYLVIPISDGKDPDYIYTCYFIHTHIHTYMSHIYIPTILEVVAGGIVHTTADIHRYVKCTLLNFAKSFEDVVKSIQESLRWLCHGKFFE
jgi:hypothetical protein